MRLRLKLHLLEATTAFPTRQEAKLQKAKEAVRAHSSDRNIWNAYLQTVNFYQRKVVLYDQQPKPWLTTYPTAN